MIVRLAAHGDFLLPDLTFELAVHRYPHPRRRLGTLLLENAAHEGRMADPAYYTGSLERLMNMPMSQLLGGLDQALDVLKEEAGDTSITYLEAVRYVHRLLHSGQADASGSAW